MWKFAWIYKYQQLVCVIQMLGAKTISVGEKDICVCATHALTALSLMISDFIHFPSPC